MKPRRIPAQEGAAFPTGLIKKITFLRHPFFSPPGHNRAPAVQVHPKSGGRLLQAVSKHDDTSFGTGQGQMSMWFIRSSIPPWGCFKQNLLKLVLSENLLKQTYLRRGRGCEVTPPPVAQTAVNEC